MGPGRCGEWRCRCGGGSTRLREGWARVTCVHCLWGAAAIGAAADIAVELASGGDVEAASAVLSLYADAVALGVGAAHTARPVLNGGEVRVRAGQ